MCVTKGGEDQPVTGFISGAADVFISQASPDGATGEALCRALDRQGLKRWIAPRNREPIGRRRQLRSATCPICFTFAFRRS